MRPQHHDADASTAKTERLATAAPLRSRVPVTMRILTVRQPWASLLVRGVKDVENRTWRTTYRGPLAIHAAAGAPRSVSSRVLSHAAVAALPRGCIVGVVRVHDVVTTSTSRWFEGPFGWVVRDALEFEDPIVGYRGQLALVRPSPQLLERLTAELRRR